MVKPLHAGLAARNAILAAELGRAGLTASASALDGPQGFLVAFDSAAPSVAAGDLGTRWEIVETGITVKLYPSCAATHPSLDAALDLQRRHRFGADDVVAVEIGVDPITPTVLLYDRPSTALEAKFSMPFCIAAALVDGRVTLETFDERRVSDPSISAVRARVRMAVDPTLDASAPPLTQARVAIRVADGRTFEARANGARGYHDRPASAEDLADKFLACAARALGGERARTALDALRRLDTVRDVNAVTPLLQP
jgi:2-methylcitrate dehydratase PrpD